jgi:predicted RNA polymerase sigma factor
MIEMRTGAQAEYRSVPQLLCRHHSAPIIVACHAEAERWQDTDWEQIVLLYDMLLHLAPSPSPAPPAIALPGRRSG